MGRGRERDPQLERFWRQAIAAWGQTGLSIRGFCQSRRLSEANFHAWKRELARRDRVAPRTVQFVPLQIRSDPLIEIALPNGLVVRSASGACPETLAALVQALRPLSC
jgi:transposase